MKGRGGRYILRPRDVPSLLAHVSTFLAFLASSPTLAECGLQSTLLTEFLQPRALHPSTVGSIAFEAQNILGKKIFYLIHTISVSTTDYMAVF